MLSAAAATGAPDASNRCDTLGSCPPADCRWSATLTEFWHPTGSTLQDCETRGFAVDEETGCAHRANAVSTTCAASRRLSPRYRPGIRWRVEAEMNALPA